MGRRKADEPPKLNRHKSSGLGYVTLNGRRHYIGPFDAPETHAAYGRLCAEWIAAGKRTPRVRERRGPARFRLSVERDVGVAELIEEYLAEEEAQGGVSRAHFAKLRRALRPLNDLYGDTLACDFGPKRLKAVRAVLIDDGLGRKTINEMIRVIVRVFQWGVEAELVESHVPLALAQVRNLKRGRTTASESRRVEPVPTWLIDAVRPLVSRQVRALIDLQLLTGARPGELLGLTPGTLDTRQDVWTAELVDHKNAHRGQARGLAFGPRAQMVLRPFLEGRAPDAPLFSPREAEAERAAALREVRTAHPTTNAARDAERRRRQRRRPPGERYDGASYRRAIERSCARAFPVPKCLRPELTTEWRKAHTFTPHRLRHNAATELRQQFGLEVARAVLGHRTIAAAQIYAEVDTRTARDVIARVG